MKMSSYRWCFLIINKLLENLYLISVVLIAILLSWMMIFEGAFLCDNFIYENISYNKKEIVEIGFITVKTVLEKDEITPITIILLHDDSWNKLHSDSMLTKIDLNNLNLNADSGEWMLHNDKFIDGVCKCESISSFFIFNDVKYNFTLLISYEKNQDTFFKETHLSPVIKALKNKNVTLSLIGNSDVAVNIAPITILECMHTELLDLDIAKKQYKSLGKKMLNTVFLQINTSQHKGMVYIMYNVKDSNLKINMKSFEEYEKDLLSGMQAKLQKGKGPMQFGIWGKKKK